MTKKKLTKDNKTKFKTLCLLIFFILCSAGIITKLYLLQIKDKQRFEKRALNQYKGRVYEYRSRGNIYDRNMRLLATNILLKSVYANPGKIQNPEKISRVVSTALGLPKRVIKAKLKKRNTSFTYIKRKVTPGEYKKLKEQNLTGIQFINEYKRFYPKTDLAAKTIGFAGIDNQGLSGIEYSLDDYLSKGGKWIRFQKDRRGRNVQLVPDDIDYYQGKSNLIITLDEVLQYYALKAIKEKVIETGAKRGLAIMMQPYTGELLAIAEYPSYNANLYQTYTTQQTRNWAISDTIEPGSTFKLILASAALEEKIAQPKDIFFCENGIFDIGGVVIHEANRKKYRWLTFTEIIGKSSNIGAVKIARRLGKDKFYKNIKKFGFGEKTGIDLPGEAKGLVREPSRWSNVSLGSISIGHEISITPLQLVTAVSAIANGGNLMKPQIVRQIIQNGKVMKNISPKIVRKVLSPETVNTMKEILSYAVVYGTGKKASINGYKVGGKTGTAQKIDPDTKKYSPDKYLSSFVGFVPLEDPAITMLIMIDEPQGTYWGGSVAAPVFKQIGEKALRYLNVPSKKNRVYSIQDSSKSSLHRISNTNLKLENKHKDNHSDLEQNANKIFDRLIAGLKKYFWEANKAISNNWKNINS